jgi:hypothetical protein
MILHLDANKPQRVCDTCYRKSLPAQHSTVMMGGGGAGGGRSLDPISSAQFNRLSVMGAAAAAGSGGGGGGTASSTFMMIQQQNSLSRGGSMSTFTPPTSKPKMPPPPRPQTERRIQSEPDAVADHEEKVSGAPPLQRGHSDGGVYPEHHHQVVSDSDSDSESEQQETKTGNHEGGR